MTSEFIQPSGNLPESEQTLLQLAESFDSNDVHRNVLDAYRRGLIMLRAKKATYTKMVALLDKVGVKSSTIRVAHFCRKHRSEINRMRKELKQGTRSAEQQSVSATDINRFPSGAVEPQPTTRRKSF